MKIARPRPGLIFAVCGLAWLAGCRTGVRIIPHVAPSMAKKNVARTGYSVQVGAFSVLDNARTLARTLSARGLEAYFFPDESGYYKVRFGDYSSKDAAELEARRVLNEALIEDYFIVSPEDYAASQQTHFGEDGLREKLVATAESFIGVQYSWGGTLGDDGLDCSGLARAVYQLHGLSLPRSSADQYEAGTAVSRSQLQRGDLVFFAVSPSRTISHVGIYVGKDAFIHAPGKDRRIRKDSLEELYFQEHFCGARTYLK